MCESFACMYVYMYHVCGWCSQRSGKSAGSPGAGVTESCELPCGCWVLNPSPLQGVTTALPHWAISPGHTYTFSICTTNHHLKSTPKEKEPSVLWRLLPYETTNVSTQSSIFSFCSSCSYCPAYLGALTIVPWAWLLFFFFLFITTLCLSWCEHGELWHVCGGLWISRFSWLHIPSHHKSAGITDVHHHIWLFHMGSTEQSKLSGLCDMHFHTASSDMSLLKGTRTLY